MSAVYGSIVLAAGVILFSFVMLAFRRPDRPAWTQWPTMETTVAIVFTALFALAFSLLFEFMVEFKRQSFGAVEGAVVAAVVVVTAVIWKALRVRARLAEYDTGQH